MAENRIKREATTRQAGENVPSWRRPEVLPTPDPQPGFEFRWVRVSIQGHIDASNVSSKLREGWTPVKAEDHPEITMVTVEHDRFADNIVIGGAMLCKAPVEMIQERTEHYERLTSSQMDSVDNNLMRESDARMPLFNDRKSTVSFGKGT